MAWKLKDEWIDDARDQHVVVFHNPDVLVPAVDPATGRPVVPVRLVPREHHLLHSFKGQTCLACGRLTPSEPLDFEEVKKETLAVLHARHKIVVQKRERNPNLRVGRGPK